MKWSLPNGDNNIQCMRRLILGGTLHFTVPADVVGVSRLPKPHHQPQFHIHTPVSAQQTTAVRLSIVSPPPAKCPQTAIHYSQTQVDYLYARCITQLQCRSEVCECRLHQGGVKGYMIAKVVRSVFAKLQC